MVYGLLLSAFTAYVLLDTFVIVRIYNQLSQGLALATAQAQLATVTSAPTEETAEPVITETAYQDENITVSLKEYQVADTRVYVAEMLLSSPEYLQSAFAQHAYGRNVTATTSEIAQEVQAILAINGDFYGSRESGYVLRNGVLYRDTHLCKAKWIWLYIRMEPLALFRRTKSQPTHCWHPERHRYSPLVRFW